MCCSEEALERTSPSWSTSCVLLYADARAAERIRLVKTLGRTSIPSMRSHCQRSDSLERFLYGEPTPAHTTVRYIPLGLDLGSVSCCLEGPGWSFTGSSPAHRVALLTAFLVLDVVLVAAGRGRSALACTSALRAHAPQRRSAFVVSDDAVR